MPRSVASSRGDTAGLQFKGYGNMLENLLKEDWTVTHDPFTLRVGGDRVHIDLGAERLTGDEKSVRKIAVEIKTFAGASPINDLEDALGQYRYRMALRRLT